MKFFYNNIFIISNWILVFIRTLIKGKIIKNKEINILFEKINKQSLRKDLYLQYKIIDTFENRFELLTIHIVLVVKAMKSDSLMGNETIQKLFDEIFKYLDNSFRELGLGDKVIEMNLNKLLRNFLKKIKLYEQALSEKNDSSLKKILINSIYKNEHSSNEKLYELIKYVRIQENYLLSKVEKLISNKEKIFKELNQEN